MLEESSLCPLHSAKSAFLGDTAAHLLIDRLTPANLPTSE